MLGQPTDVSAEMRLRFSSVFTMSCGHVNP